MFATINDTTQFVLLSELYKEDGITRHRFIPIESENLPDLVVVVNKYNENANESDKFAFEFLKGEDGELLVCSKEEADQHIPKIEGGYAEMCPSYVMIVAYAEVGDLLTACPIGANEREFYQSQIQDLSWAIHCY